MGNCCSSPKPKGGGEKQKKSATVNRKESTKEPYSEMKKMRKENGHGPSQNTDVDDDANANTSIQQNGHTHQTDIPDINIDIVDDEPSSEDEPPPLTEFGAEGDSEGEFKMAKAVTVFLYGEIIVTEHVNERVYLFDKNGVFKQTLASSKDERSQQGKVRYPTDVAITPLGHIAMTDQTRYVKIFNIDGEYLHRFNIKVDDDDSEVKPRAYSLDVAFDEQILVGDIRRKCLIAFKELDAKSEFEKRINLNLEPHFLATNRSADGTRQAIVSDWKLGEVHMIDTSVADSSENFIRKIEGFSVEGKPALCKGVACDEENNIYIAMSQTDGTEKKNVYYDRGHIHQYSSDGVFERCIKKGLLHPRGLTWHNGSLYIANTHSVHIVNTAAALFLIKPGESE